MRSGSDLAKAQGGMQVISGPALPAGPLFLAGVAFAGSGAIIGSFVGHEKTPKATDAEGDGSGVLAKDGLLREDGPASKRQEAALHCDDAA
ncbi:hypothetical protein [Teichococcus deserti]|uniref:hypothetical protein n=1 Tax=Teichococcus deserti TaxID=1817963 RepID=UPI001055A002|nr:hypothetical protein [Pseudoroseomonas deserti]